jgi:Tol biopolymer transport system component
MLGTLQYQAPEQLEGKQGDARADLFAFGALLFEMLTARKAVEGSTPATVITSILEREAGPLSLLPPHAPPFLHHVLKRCLAKDPDQRWQTARDVMLELESVNDVATASPGKKRLSVSSRRERVAWFVAAALALILVGALALRPQRGVAEPLVSRMSVVAPEGTTFIGGYAAPYLALSPDGRRLAIVPTLVGTPPMLWVRDLDSLVSRALTGTEGVTFPFWSPDGRSIGFFADGKLKTIAIDGGAPQVVCDAPDARGGAWGREGVIVFTPQLDGPLYRVSASGGQPAVITTLDASRAEVSHRLPSFLPDGRHFVFLVQSGRPENSALYVGAVDSSPSTPLGASERRMLNVRGSKAVYAGGTLFYARDGALVAQPFDTSRLELTGEPVPLGDQVRTRAGVYGDALFSVAANGTLAYWNGGPSITNLAWFDRQGRALGSVGKAADYLSLDLSPDEKRVAVERIDPTTLVGDIWLIDVDSNIASRFTSDPGWDFNPLWSPDGTRILFGSIRGGLQSLFVKATSGRATDESFLKSSDALGPADWSATNDLVVFQNMTKFKVGVAPLEGERSPRLVLQSDFAEATGRLSPDGRWLAYTSNESGTWDVYVQPFPALDRKWRVSPDGGWRPAWRRDGKELFFMAADQRLMAISITTSPSFVAGAPVALFPLRAIPVPPTLPRQQYSVSARGDRFLVNTVVEPAAPTPVTVVLNWTAALRH